MRKKLFAVIMSAMMMITFMPAMAFAWSPAPVSQDTAWYVDGVKATDNAFTDCYDGAEHKAVFNVNATKAKEAGLEGLYVESYTVFYYPQVIKNGSSYVATTAAKRSIAQKDAPSVKEAGKYEITVNAKYISGKKYTDWEEAPMLTLTVTPREVWLASSNVSKTKQYDTKGFVIDDSFFTITGKAAAPNETEADKKYREATTGLVAGDKLITNAITTAADVDDYTINWASVTWNANYAYNGINFYALPTTVKIVKAENYVKMPKSNKTYTAKALKKGAKSFALKATAEFGTAKITKVQGDGHLYVKNGKVVVKKGTKKGTYKMTVNAHVQGTKNYAAADCKKVVCVKVR